ncbi:hypothetical protein A2706_01300 [Candidatus Peribacteria bacterium RIFCSPHIGHO2_01_FULL_51_35]|nr:MAG: hypothetical protein A2706_01300 [Candidatus Peribacteria bacterium RIFCSPHIGHO2_01_FULL_51_35]
MKRLAFVIGFVLLLAPNVTHAQSAVSPYMQRVITRAEAGIAFAKESGSLEAAVTFFLPSFRPFMEMAGSTVLGLIDTKQRIIAMEKDLTENTACLHIDLFLLEMEIKRVQEAVNDEAKKGNVLGVLRLQDILLFLDERLDIVLRGSRDPTIQDGTWTKKRMFDRPGTDTAGSICPFHTDYLPPSIASGYGCDAEKLQSIVEALESPLKETVVAETLAATDIASVLRKYVQEAQALLSLEQRINRLLGRSTDTIVSSTEIPAHRTVTGCPVEWPEDADRNKDSWPDDALAWELRHMRFERDERKIMHAFQELRVTQSAARPVSDAFRSESQNPLEDTLNAQGARTFSAFSRKQGLRESEIFAQSADTHLAISDSIGTLKKSIGVIAQLAKNRDKLRGFVRDFAYYLRRTCIDRPCNARLDQILKIVFQDDCFPYTNGEYLDGKSYEQCKAAAGLEEVKP